MATKIGKSTAAVSLRRMYVDCRYGQLHLATAFPPSGGFDELTALLFLRPQEQFAILNPLHLAEVSALVALAAMVVGDRKSVV